jgi:hypothetical protein
MWCLSLDLTATCSRYEWLLWWFISSWTLLTSNRKTGDAGFDTLVGCVLIIITACIADNIGHHRMILISGTSSICSKSHFGYLGWVWISCKSIPTLKYILFFLYEKYWDFEDRNHCCNYEAMI